MVKPLKALPFMKIKRMERKKLSSRFQIVDGLTLMPSKNALPSFLKKMAL